MQSKLLIATIELYNNFEKNKLLTNNYFAHYTLVQPCPVITTTITATDVTCNGGNDGSASLSISNGTAPYTYLWSNGEATEDLTGLKMFFDELIDPSECEANVRMEYNRNLVLKMDSSTPTVHDPDEILEEIFLKVIT